MRKFALALILLASCPGMSLLAQVPTATVNGLVRDSQGALIPKAHVSVTNIKQGIERDSLSNPDGSYSLPNLQPDDYLIVISAPGFATVIAGLNPGEPVLPYPVPAVNTLGKGQLLLMPGDRLNFGAVGVTLSAGFGQVMIWGVADCLEEWYLPYYLG